MYLGSKADHAPAIMAIVGALPGIQRAVDLFAGALHVSMAMKRADIWVHANDTAVYSAVAAHAIIATDARCVAIPHMERILAHLNAVPSEPGYIARTLCHDPAFFSPANGAKADAIRAAIDQMALTETERAIALTALLVALDATNSHSGTYQADIKQKPKRFFTPLVLRLPPLLPGTGAWSQLDANSVAPTLTAIDLAYLDPPYSCHVYYTCYHPLVTLVLNDAPRTYGSEGKRLDCRAVRSPYNSKRYAPAAWADLVQGIRAPYILASTSDEAIMSPPQLTALLAGRGHVAWVAFPHRRYIGSQTGIYNPDGEKVGTPRETTNHEYLILCGPTRSAVERAMDAARRLISPTQLALFGGSPPSWM
jgi:adenine-specific DNA methylase